VSVCVIAMPVCALTRPRRYVKRAISQTPNNASAWNYLRGVLEHNRVPFATLRDFVKMYAAPREPGPSDYDADLDNPAPSELATLPCPGAIEFMAEIYEQEPGALDKAVRLYNQLAIEHDVIRKRSVRRS
jgi:protein farnesyltransferase/geranylgeranyltransferase type-1 subunit alpha